ncbi:hypothetical protein JOD43_002410 [Pullulanibacillus pueri]|nr:hypothetical protein [Pullulanibacillus pueri]
MGKGWLVSFLEVKEILIKVVYTSSYEVDEEVEFIEEK